MTIRPFVAVDGLPYRYLGTRCADQFAPEFRGDDLLGCVYLTEEESGAIYVLDVTNDGETYIHHVAGFPALVESIEVDWHAIKQAGGGEE